ncbi:hypothetical protein C1H46_000071 [Malus baccata]|uniref:Uncharacterized protein n=1 Tax=Malus baccata TaxID=106549 RepID=A0A540NSY4_MALBA|nr:hypothetical protein C1H46_000071 [Malus baccata]
MHSSLFLLALPPSAKAATTSSPEWVSEKLRSFEEVGLEEEEAVSWVPLHQLQVLGKINVVDGFAAEDNGGGVEFELRPIRYRSHRRKGWARVGFLGR